jgi:hypothetical protein
VVVSLMRGNALLLQNIIFLFLLEASKPINICRTAYSQTGYAPADKRERERELMLVADGVVKKVEQRYQSHVQVSVDSVLRKCNRHYNG